MKNTKKIITLALAAAMLSATGITAFAADPETKATNVSYNVDPSYTVSIPAAVTLSDADVTADITASDVILEDGKQIKVDLTAASNTASGSTFNAKNGDSAVTYTITGDSAISVGDTVATFAANGSKTLTFSAADKSAATVAGAHTETLTFGIAVEDAVTTPTVGTVFPIGTADLGDYYYWNHEIDADRLSKKFRNFGNATISISSNYSHPTLGNYRVIRIVSSTAQYIDWEATQMDPNGPWATWQNSRSINYFKVDNYDTTPTGIKIASGSGTEDDPFTFELVFD